MAIQKQMSVEEAKQIVSDALAAHGDEWDLKPLLESLPENKRPMVARYFTELRKRGEVQTEINVDTATGEVKHKVRRGRPKTT